MLLYAGALEDVSELWGADVGASDNSTASDATAKHVPKEEDVWVGVGFPPVLAWESTLAFRCSSSRISQSIVKSQ